MGCIWRLAPPDGIVLPGKAGCSPTKQKGPTAEVRGDETGSHHPWPAVIYKKARKPEWFSGLE